MAGSVRPALRRAVGLVGAWAAVVGPHFVWRLVYYGHPLPNTFYVKVGGLGTARLAGGVEMLGRAASQWDVWVTLVVFGIGLGSLPRRPVWRLAVLAVLGTVASFVVVGGDFIAFFGPRFLMPAYPLVLLVTTEGVRRIAVGWRRPGVMLAAALALALLVEAAWLSWPRRFYRLHGIQQLNDSWRETADWILRETPPGATVALGSAGIIPYLTDRATIDMFGLTDAHIAHHGRPDPSAPPGHQKVDPAYVLDRQPAIIVSRIDEQGRPLTAGLAEFADRIRTEYELAGLVKTRGGRPLSRRWVVPGRRWTGTLHERGYDTGIFVRRGEWAQQVKSSPPPMTRRGAHR